MFSFIKNALHSIYNQFTGALGKLFQLQSIDDASLAELSQILIKADTGIHTTRMIVDNLKKQVQNGTIKEGVDLKNALAQQLTHVLESKPFEPQAAIYLLVGINGSGKTTFAGKLGNSLKSLGKKVLFVAGDTFRAAATEQLLTWGSRLGIDVITGKENQDPASVVFAGCEKFKHEQYDALIIDTAGRLQTKINLMKELEKIRKIIDRQLPNQKVCTLLTVDAMLGQNSFEQAKLFHEATSLNGIVLTKIDGTGKGGIVFSISQELKIPIAYISYGEQPDQLKLFDPAAYINDLLSE